MSIGSILMDALNSAAGYQSARAALAPPRPLRQRVRDKLATKTDRQERPEDLFRREINCGDVKIVRRRGKPPLLVLRGKRRRS